MQKVIAVLCGCCCVALLVTAVVSPRTRVHHEASSAYTAALDQAVERLEKGGRAVLGATAVMMNATEPAVTAQGAATSDGRYTCDTYNATQPTCQGAVCPTHTADPNGHTCRAAYTCQMATCQTYDPQSVTCDPNRADCAVQHTTE